jgi:hypothetical protein
MINLTSHYVIISKISSRISYYMNWIYSILPLRWIIIRNLRNQVSSLSKKSLEKNLKFILGSFQEVPNGLKSSEDAKVILQLADKTLNHEFDFLGSGLTKLHPIDWHIDFKNGFRWPKGKFYIKYKKIDLSNSADVKVPWELSRCHHLLWLGEAYLITKEEKYAQELVNQLDWWIDENPLMYSINWTCTMDVAIRAVNWVYAINMIVSSSYVTDKLSKKLNKSLFEHGWFIYNNLEKWYPYSANHYAANITGLLFLAQLFHDTRDGKKWWHYALKEYFLEVRLQVLPSGAHFERSISYHRLMTELFAYSYFMLKRVKESIPLDIHARIESMFDFVDHYTKPNGLAPQMGDNDDGRLLPFVRRDFRAHDYLLSIGAKAFNKFYKNLILNDLVLDSFFLLGEQKNFGANQQISLPTSKVKAHVDAGFVILNYGQLFLMFTNTSLSCYSDFTRDLLGTHTHADGLSFELSLGKVDFIVDPGSYVYTASGQERNRFRSTKMHNTVTIGGQDQVEILDANLFSVKGFNEVDQISVMENQGGVFVAGSRKWKLPFSLTASHHRKINLINETEIEITDQISCTSEQSFVWYFYLAPEVNPQLVANKDVVLRGQDNSVLDLSFKTSRNFAIELIDSEISPSYGVLIPTKALKISIQSDSDFLFFTKIRY